MRRLILVILVISILASSTFLSFSLAPKDEVDISAEAGIVIDALTGDILFGKNPHKPMYPASTTKIMTAILTIENANLNDKIIIDKETPFTDGSSMSVKEGEEFTVEQLLYGLMVKSANDGAVALAKHISGSVEEFAKLMNKRARELGALNTHFTNPHGLPEENHTTTAYDLAVIARHAMTIPKFREVANTVRYQIPITEKTDEIRYYKNTNRLLWGVGPSHRIKYNGKWIDIKYDIVDGIKTGYTFQAQQCLVSTGFKGSRRVISVVLKTTTPNVYLDTRRLIDYGLDNFSIVNIVGSNDILKTLEIENGKEKELNLVAEDSIIKALPNNYTSSDIKHTITLNPEIAAPINSGDILGKVSYSLNGEVMGEINLVAAKSIDETEVSTIMRKIESLKDISFFNVFFFLILIYIIWRTFVTIKRIRRRRRRRRWKW